MTSTSRSSSHSSVNPHHPSHSRWLVHAGEESPPSHASLLAMAQLHQAFEALQAMLAERGHAPLRAPAARMAHLCRDIEQAVVETICNLAQGQLGLQALLDLLDLLACLGDDARLPSSRLRELLTPLDRQIGDSLRSLSKVL